MTTDIPISSPTILTTSFDEIDRAIVSLHSHRDEWAKTSIQQRVDYLQLCLESTITVAEEWAIAACNAKGIDPQSALAGEEWLVGPISLIRNLRLLMTTLQANGQLPPSQIRQMDGQMVAEVIVLGLSGGGVARTGRDKHPRPDLSRTDR
jgi:acyl-CoA reductase-like NAD-dependent aldehyde dehydrogenase